MTSTMTPTELFNRLSRPTAVRVSSAVQQVLADLDELLAYARQAEDSATGAALEQAVAVVALAARDHLAGPLYGVHPQLRPVGFEASAPDAAPGLGEEEDTPTDEHDLPAVT